MVEVVGQGQGQRPGEEGDLDRPEGKTAMQTAAKSAF